MYTEVSLSTQKATGSGSANAKKRAASRGAGSAKNSGKAAHSKRSAKKDAVVERHPLLESRIKRELIGILIAILAIALFIATVVPGTAILSRVVSDFLRLVIGLGAYILPVLMLIWAASFFIEKSVVNTALRLGIGLAIIFVSALAILGVMTPDSPRDPGLIFDQAALMAHGGFVGGGIAWVLLRLVGQGIALVILVGLILIGAVLIGFSITGVVSRLRNLLAKRHDAAEEEPSSGPYELGEDRAEGRTRRRARGKSLAATVRLGDGAVPGGLEGDFSEGDQGRIPLDDLDGLDGHGDLGSTRRILAGNGAAGGEADGEADEGDRGREDSTVLLGKGGAAKPQSRGKGSSVATDAHLFDGADFDLPFELPSPKLLKASRAKASTKAGESELRRTAAELQATIEEFGVDARVEGWVAGPTVTLFRISLGEGVRLNKINALADDIALALAVQKVRIFSPIPGTTLVGIEVPNVSRSMVLLGDVLPDALPGPLQLAIGKDVEGDSIIADLEKMPHLLIGGTTGSGKSVAINAMIMSLLMRTTPAQVRMILIDPKMVELSLYNDIPHLYVPVVTDAQKAAAALAWCVLEMERRLKVFQQAGVKKIAQYNDQVRKEREKAARAAQAAAARAAKDADAGAEVGADEGAGAGGGAGVGAGAGARGGAADADATVAFQTDFGEDGLTEMPLIVIVIDELADLMMVAGKEVETSISRLAQLARAAGLHLIIATQRPSTNVITGLIKANIVNRIAFNVASGIDSRVILDSPGAENLIGIGDLLFSRPESGKQRIQGCYVSEPEIETVVDFLKAQAQPEYHEDILATAVGGVSTFSLSDGGESDDDPLIWEAADIVVSSQLGSTSTLQRRLKVGYARAGRIMDMLEHKGIVGPPTGNKPRDVLIDDVLDVESLRALEASDDGGW
jgi:S-DNA-T family DNA segregation ATPase FtsK/SpoIIIE